MRSEIQIRQTQVREALRSWVRSKEAPDHGLLTDTTPLSEERRLRSLHLPELLLLERLRGGPIDVDDLQAGDFRDIDILVNRFCGVAVAS